DSDERAWAFFVIMNQGFAGNPHIDRTIWSRSPYISSSGKSHRTSSWIGHINRLSEIRDRLIRVQIENRDALDVIRYWDRDDTVFYLDPPYPMESRRSSTYPDEFYDHSALIELLKTIKGNFALSSYDGTVYESLLDIS